MRRTETAAELEFRLCLAVRPVAEDWKQKEVAAFFGATERAVRGWVAVHREVDDEGLQGRPHSRAKTWLSACR